MNYDLLIESLSEAFQRFRESVIQFLPHFAAAVAILLIGFAIAYLIRVLTVRFLKNLGRFIPNKDIQNRLQPARMERSARVISAILYWILVFFFLTAATEVLGLPAVTVWLSQIATYLPKALVAVFIVAAGIVGSLLLRDMATAAATSAGLTYAGTLGKLVQSAILLVTILIGIEQIGIDITFLTSVILILFSAMFLGAALAFGLGAGTSVSNILASYYIQKVFKVGRSVRIGGLEGQISEVTPVAVILETSEGRVYVPSKQFNEMTSTILKKNQ